MRLHLCHILTVIGLSCQIFPLHATESAKKPIENDWIQDPPGANVCHGHYVLPEFPSQMSINTVISADDGSFVINAGQSELTGNVLIEEPGQRLFADKVTLIRNAEGQAVSANAQGGFLYETSEYRLWGDNASILFANNEVEVWQATYRWYARQARGQASHSETSDGHPLVLMNATYTTCAPGDNLWNLKAKKVVLNDATGRGESFHTILYMKDLPVLYSPYLNFPIDDRRKSGFLMPEFRTSSINGFGITTPYYFNLAPNYDATLYPNYMNDRGLQMGGQYRFLSRVFSGEFYGEYLPDDRAFAHFREHKLDSTENPDPSDPRRKNLDNASDNRWLFHTDISGRHGQHWTTALDYTQVSDDEYFIDFGSDTFGDDQRQLKQRAEANYNNDEWRGQVFVQNYQTLQPFDSNLVEPPYQILPHGQLDYFPYLPDYPFTFKNTAMVTVFDHDPSNFLNEPPTTGNRYHIAPTLAFPRRNAYSFFIPSVTVNETYYDLSLSSFDKSQDLPSYDNRLIPQTSVDMGLIFERDTSYFGKPYIQTLEPRAYYLYVPYQNQSDIPNFQSNYYEFTVPQLFRNNRFAGIDRIGDANQLSLALTTRFYDEALGGERFSATGGGIIYFENRRVSLCSQDIDPDCIYTENIGYKDKVSPLVGNLMYRFDPNWSFIADARYNAWYNTENDLFSGRFKYQRGERNIVHAGLRYEQSGNQLYDNIVGDGTEDLLQLDLGASVGVTEHLTLLGRWYYDVSNQYTVDGFGGLEYEGCCYAIRLGARRYLQINKGESARDRDYDTEVFFQWVFKGLAGVGRSPVNYFTTNLPGYRDRFEVEM